MIESSTQYNQAIHLYTNDIKCKDTILFVTQNSQLTQHSDHTPTPK